MNTSQLGRLNARDFALGLIVAVLTGVITFLAQTINAPAFDYATFDWAQLVGIALSAGIAYLSKNLLSDDEGKVLGSL